MKRYTTGSLKNYQSAVKLKNKYMFSKKYSTNTKSIFIREFQQLMIA